MNPIGKLRLLRRRLSESFDHVPDVAENLAELGLAEDDDPHLILDTIDDEIAALEAGTTEGGDTHV